jgi:hypothetical protein
VFFTKGQPERQLPIDVVFDFSWSANLLNMGVGVGVGVGVHK